MCGIAGFISSNPRYDAEGIVAEMLHRIKHRGPDQMGNATFGDATMGMVRLSIVDHEKHSIPYQDPLHRGAIVYNGEIYNHQELRESIGQHCLCKTASDAETTLQCYLSRGIDSFSRHNGMYAFAIYDQQENAVYLVRDKLGEKTLYYVEGKDYFAFASEMKALLTLVTPRFNAEAVSYRAYEFTVGRETLFKDIHQLEPGEYIRIADGRFAIHSYWKIWENRIEVPDDENRIVNTLAELVEDAIRLRTRNSAHQMACFVSGGVDSALVAAIARPNQLFTAHYDFPDFDELAYAKELAWHIDRPLEVLRPTKNDFLRSRRRIAYCLDTPCTWTSFTLWTLLEAIGSRGMRVVLNGDGADELFGGYHRYHLLHHDEQIRSLAAMQRYEYLINRYYGSPVERYARLINRCENIYDEAVNKYLQDTIAYYFDKMNGDVLHLMGLTDVYSTMQVLLQMADRVCMAFGVENRSPFLDYRLVQFAFSMPSRYKIRDGITKWALKQVARRFIPRSIVDRLDKRGFSAP
ncbi:asparagine synthase (glutamine-hydrolyzing), partial [candidate division KSB3 bacterium]|nr:asparagine synthase (glutamine-hydrolyzing) [candidate division KSB3 bacterium]